MPSSEESPVVPSLASILTSLTTSLQSTLETLPHKPSYLPPPNGISILDLKNEAMLSYLHNIVYLVILRLRSAKGAEKADITTCVEQLVELRAIIEKGVKPVEAKLRHQIDKVVRRSVDAEMSTQALVNGKRKGKDKDDSSEADSDDEDNDDDDDDYENEPVADDTPKHGSIRINTTLDIDGQPVIPKTALPTITATESLTFRPNPSALPKSKDAEASTSASTTDGIYRPPRISAVSMPTGPPAADPLSTARTERVNKKSHNLDEFIASELSSAPLAEPSIGSTIISSGRAVKTAQTRREEAEKMEYEEANFVRLPKPSKKEAAQKKRRETGSGADTFGGEDWRSFAGDLDRLTARAGKSGGKVGAVLERSRKRKDGGDDARESGGMGKPMGKRFNRIVGRENSKRRKKA